MCLYTVYATERKSVQVGCNKAPTVLWSVGWLCVCMYVCVFDRPLFNSYSFIVGRFFFFFFVPIDSVIV